MHAMLERARTAGVASMIITGGSLTESKSALAAAKKHGESCNSLFLVVSTCLPFWKGSMLQLDVIQPGRLSLINTATAQKITWLSSTKLSNLICKAKGEW